MTAPRPDAAPDDAARHDADGVPLATGAPVPAPNPDTGADAPADPAAPSAPNPLLGYAAIIFAVAIWAGWIVATRDQVGAFSPLDLSLVRYGLPALILAPIWLKKGIVPKGEDWRLLAIMTIGWGGGFVMLTAKGLETVPASLFGPMVPATLPLFVAIWDRFVEDVRIHAQRGVGLALILASIALTLGPGLAGGPPGVLQGAPYLALAAAGWAAFTIAFRRTSLSGLEATAYVCLWSSPFLLIAALIEGTHLADAAPLTLLWVALSQAVLSGIGAVAGFAYAVRHLGAARTSSFTSLVPMGAAAGGWLFLGEEVGPLGWAAVVFACLGVAAVNGVFAGAFGRR
ncbi:DMT family transporter [Rhodovulum sp. DZ06]|uniref:DMT family transporter n=1 Tax=Rhodovulum sp. DZ06 TaxID=3425126 RepID=UPI003D3551E3